MWSSTHLCNGHSPSCNSHHHADSVTVRITGDQNTPKWRCTAKNSDIVFFSILVNIALRVKNQKSTGGIVLYFCVL